MVNGLFAKFLVVTVNKKNNKTDNSCSGKKLKKIRWLEEGRWKYIFEVALGLLWAIRKEERLFSPEACFSIYRKAHLLGFRLALQT